MKAMTKTQLASLAGVSLATFSSWLKPIEGELAAMGYLPGRRCIPPHVVRHLAERFCIDVEPSTKFTANKRQ
jgi:hypothetical protein